ncbi:3-oxoacyl-ACP reductase [Hahella sp. CCB-MM4]|uniref:3-oxoacyl-ACP reductase n=1 Tax=Hahella sp. (strain CCB-MM4) TaxID=1926491 RepID=UPI000B9BEA6A|nr:3-oxoacyl-ACP reductase [Hahella sp. CCB-MM4]OZG70943.1 3-oxoacyl-ACP reductase [Hahella sp. CCB-MM4]
MSDLLLTLANSPGTSKIIKTIGLPTPTILARETTGFTAHPLKDRNTLLLSPSKGGCLRFLKKALTDAGAAPKIQWPSITSKDITSKDITSKDITSNDINSDGTASDDIRKTGEKGNLEGNENFQIVIFDGTAIQDMTQYRLLFDSFQPLISKLTRNARILVLAREPEEEQSPQQAALARGLEGFTRSLAKEIGKKGSTANLIYLSQGAETRLEMPIRFLCSHHSTFVSGQALHLSNQVNPPERITFSETLADKFALVTGSAGGIGAETAKRLAQEGAKVICLDIPAAEESLSQLAEEINGVAITLDITQQDAADKLADFIEHHSGGIDILVHNAGITRDKSLAKMPEHYWDSVIAVNLGAIFNIDECLKQRNLLNSEGRVICLSSISGIAGNFGQSNYAATKAALIGYVKAQAPVQASRGITFNAIAPGFIETNMTAAMPVLTREAGRRLNALSQGGLPHDVAEAITFLASPGAYGITGQTLRVCGLGIMGA